MANWRSVEFHIPEAQTLADLTGVEADLMGVERICTRFLLERENEQPDWELLEIACSAALIKYGRAFGSGVRLGVPNAIIDSLDEDYRAWHRHFKDARDKWIAHSVNAFEENEVSAWLMPPERGPIGVTSISVRQHRIIALGPDAMNALKLLSQKVRERVQDVLEEEKKKVLAIANSLPPEQFYKQIDKPRSADSSSPGKPRSRK